MKRFSFIFLFAATYYAASAQPGGNNFSIDPVYPVSCTPVKDQYLSATCWSFASNSFIESELLRMGKPEIDLSEMYTARLSYINKIRTHLRLNGSNYFTPGGQFHDVQWVLKNYGAVPEKIYSGKPGGEHNHNHGQLDTLMKRYVNHMLGLGKTKPDDADMQYINGLLDRYLGKLPGSFTEGNRQVTPAIYLTGELGFNPDDYIEVSSYSHHPWYKTFVLENKYNWSSGKYLNVPLNEFIRITDEALEKGFSVLWNGDVNETGFRFAQGTASLPYTVTNPEAERQKTFEDSSSYMDHMMHIVGKTTDNKGHKWYYIKNSWGSYSNSTGGYLFMDENYFAVKTAAIVIHKQAIPEAIKKKIGL